MHDLPAQAAEPGLAQCRQQGCSSRLGLESGRPKSGRLATHLVEVYSPRCKSKEIQQFCQMGLHFC